jgi:hypothetical protein
VCMTVLPPNWNEEGGYSEGAKLARFPFV